MNGTTQYTIKPGDTYWGLASSMGGGGGNWGTLKTLNPNVDYNSLKVGSTINIPSSWGSSGSTSSPSSPSGSSQQVTPAVSTGNLNSTNQADVLAGLENEQNPINQELIDSGNQEEQALSDAYSSQATQLQTLQDTMTANKAGYENTLLQGQTGALGSLNTALTAGNASLVGQGNIAAKGANAAITQRGGQAGSTGMQAGATQAAAPYVSQQLDLQNTVGQEAAGIWQQWASGTVSADQLSDSQIYTLAQSIAGIDVQKAKDITAVQQQINQTIYAAQNGLISEADAQAQNNRNYQIQQQTLDEAYASIQEEQQELAEKTREFNVTTWGTPTVPASTPIAGPLEPGQTSQSVPPQTIQQQEFNIQQYGTATPEAGQPTIAQTQAGLTQNAPANLQKVKSPADPNLTTYVNSSGQVVYSVNSLTGEMKDGNGNIIIPGQNAAAAELFNAPLVGGLLNAGWNIIGSL